VAGTVALLVCASHAVHAHKPVTSPFDYNNGVFPLLREHCGQCHAEGGPAPMSLMTYKDAVPWAESIRDELTGGRMPPWPVDPRSRPVKGGHPISSHDLDAIVTWASGGTPHTWKGDPNAPLPKVVAKNHWKLGAPDVTIAMTSEHTVGKDALEEVTDFSLPVPITEEKFVKAADLLPGAPGMVRDAIISIENGETLALWQPTADVVPATPGTAFRLEPGSKIHLQIHYKKHYDQEQVAIADKSTVGLYFAPATSDAIHSTKIAPAAPNPSAAQTFSADLPQAARIVALAPLLDAAYAAVEVAAVSPDGTRTPLLKLRGPRPQWFYRYWLEQPFAAPAGTKIEATTTPLAGYADDLKTPKRFPLQLGVAMASGASPAR
jgi:hypothetical protein